MGEWEIVNVVLLIVVLKWGSLWVLDNETDTRDLKIWGSSDTFEGARRLKTVKMRMVTNG